MIEFKRRRLHLKQSHSVDRNITELREGLTYQTNFCLSNPEELLTMTIPTKIDAPVITLIENSDITHSKPVT